MLIQTYLSPSIAKIIKLIIVILKVKVKFILIKTEPHNYIEILIALF